MTEWQNEQKGQKRQKDKKTEGQKEKGRRRFIMYTWFYYDWELIVIYRFILIVQQVVARLTLVVILAMDYNIPWF